MDFVAAVGALLDDLAPRGYEPTLVGGMALVTLGSPRVTKDFDFLVIEEARAQKALTEVFYRHGFELVSRTDAHGNVIRTIDSREVASARLRIDRPSVVAKGDALSLFLIAYPRGGQRTDVLLEFVREGELVAQSLSELPPPGDDGRASFVAAVPTGDLRPGGYDIRVLVKQGGLLAHRKARFVLEGEDAPRASSR